MDLAQANLVGWGVGYVIGAVVVVLVAVLVLAITATVHRIAAVAADATRSLEQTRERTEVLWALETTAAISNEIRSGAVDARKALGG